MASTLPSSVVEDVKKMMSKFDSNNDECLSWDEVRNRLRDNGSKDPDFATYSMFCALDKNKDMKISLKEVEQHKMDVYAKKCEKIIKRDINNMLKEYDSNKDGRITYDECLKVFKNDSEVNNPELSARYLFSAIDKDNDKVITRDELKSYVTKFNNFGPSQ